MWSSKEIMIDTFITTQSKRHPLRDYFFNLTYHAFKMNNVNPRLILDQKSWDRYFIPETIANSKFYILADDDCIPCSPDMIRKGCRIMDLFPEIGMLGFAWKHGLQEDEVSGYMGKIKFLEDGKMLAWEFGEVGGIRIIRKGIIAKKESLPEPDYKGTGGDRIFSEMIRKQGYKVAICPDLYFHHLGEGVSTIWPQRPLDLGVNLNGEGR